MNIPWSDNKNARQIYREYVNVWGATYEGDTSDGHHIFRFPNGTETTLAHSPSAGWSWIQARRNEAARITGKPFREKRNPHAAKNRQARRRQQAKSELDRLLADALAAENRALFVRQNRDRYRELRKIQSLMGARGSEFGKTYHPSVIVFR